MVDTIYSAMDFYGQGDPYFGGTAADWALYKTEDGRHAFISAADAQRVMADFPTEAEAEKAGAAASTRKGSISAVPIKPRLEVPTAHISWIVGNKHVSEEDGELAEDFADRAKRAGAADADLIAQIVAYALACHRANQGPLSLRQTRSRACRGGARRSYIGYYF